MLFIKLKRFEKDLSRGENTAQLLIAMMMNAPRSRKVASAKKKTKTRSSMH